MNGRDEHLAMGVYAIGSFKAAVIAAGASSEVSVSLLFIVSFSSLAHPDAITSQGFSLRLLLMRGVCSHFD